MSSVVHIASFVVCHRVDAAAAIDAALAALPSAELAAREGTRSVVLCEAGSEADIVDGMQRLHALDGVLAVNLIYHHAEPASALAQELADADPT